MFSDKDTYTLTDSGLIDLDGADAGFLEVNDLITESKSQLLGLEFAGDVSAGEGPVEDGNWASKHTLHGPLGEALSVATPANGHGARAADIGDDDGGSDVSKNEELSDSLHTNQCERTDREP